MVLTWGLVLGGIAQAITTVDAGFAPSRRHESVQRLGARTVNAADPRNSRVRPGFLHGQAVEGPASIGAVPPPASSQFRGVPVSQFLRSVAVTPPNGRSPPLFL